MPRFLLVVALATLLPPGGPGAHAQPVDRNPHVVAGEARSGVRPCCAPPPAADAALPCAGVGAASCLALAVPAEPSPAVAGAGDTIPAAGATTRYRCPTLPGLFRPPSVIRT